MSTANIQFYKTAIGIQKAIHAQNNGMKLRLSHYKLSSSRFVPVANDPRESLTNIIHEGTISVGLVSQELALVRISLSILSTSLLNVGSIGLYADDGTLFAVAGVSTGNLFTVHPNITFLSMFGLSITEFDPSALLITVDNTGTVAQQIMISHETDENPHPQYASRIEFEDFRNRINTLFSELLHVGRWIGTDSTTWNPSTAFEPFFGYETYWRLRPHIPYGVISPSEPLQVITNIAGSSNTAMSNTTRIWQRTASAQVDPTYSLTVNRTSMNEGESAIFTLTTTNLPQGTNVPFIIYGVSASDITPSSLTGNFTINASGTATYTVSAVNDMQLEGNETLTLQLSGAQLSQHAKSVTIVDTSIPLVPTYSLSSSRNSINEGESVVFTLTTSNVDQGTVIPWAITGVSASDITPNNLTGSFVIGANGTATYTVTAVNDNLTEGNETLTLGLTGSGLTGYTKSVTIMDTSTTPIEPTYEIAFYGDLEGTFNQNVAIRGSTTYLLIRTQNVPNGTVFDVNWVGGGLSTMDFVGLDSMQQQITVNDNFGYFLYEFAAEGQSSNNVEVSVSQGGQVRAVIILNLIGEDDTENPDI